MSAVRKYFHPVGSADPTPVFFKRWPLLSGAATLLHNGVKLRCGATNLHRNGPVLSSGAAFLYRNAPAWNNAASPQSSGRANLGSLIALLHSAAAALSHAGPNLLHTATIPSSATPHRSNGAPFPEGRHAFPPRPHFHRSSKPNRKK